MTYPEVKRLAHEVGGDAWSHHDIETAMIEVIHPLRPWRRFSVEWSLDLFLGVLEVLEIRHPRVPKGRSKQECSCG